MIIDILYWRTLSNEPAQATIPPLLTTLGNMMEAGVPFSYMQNPAGREVIRCHFHDDRNAAFLQVVRDTYEHEVVPESVKVNIGLERKVTDRRKHNHGQYQSKNVQGVLIRQVWGHPEFLHLVRTWAAVHHKGWSVTGYAKSEDTPV